MTNNNLRNFIFNQPNNLNSFKITSKKCALNIKNFVFNQSAGSASKIIQNTISVDMFSQWESFVTDIVGELSKDGIDTTGWELDHLAYRVESMEEYSTVCNSLINSIDGKQPLGICLGVVQIGGRPISTIHLINPLVHPLGYTISCIEIPSPKEGSHYASGFEHAEFVIGPSMGVPTEIPEEYLGTEKPVLEQFIQKYPELTFDTRAIDKELNADVSKSYTRIINGKETKMSAKLHLRPLYTVVAFENILAQNKH